MKRMFTCSVGCQHALEVERWEEAGEWDDTVNGPIEVNVWYQAGEPLRYRLRNAWRILRGKEVLTEGICLMRDEARDMGLFLIGISSAKSPTDFRRPVVSNTNTVTTTSPGERK